MGGVRVLESQIQLEGRATKESVDVDWSWSEKTRESIVYMYCIYI